MEFIKVQGTENDFLFIDGRFSPQPIPSPDWVRRWCHRRRGIGADGVLLYLEDEAGRPRMRVYNSDGSQARMCGNGLRCFVRVLRDVYGVQEPVMSVQTESGLRRCRCIQNDENGTGDSIEIEMRGVFGWDGSSLAGVNIQPIRVPVKHRFASVPLYPVCVGNPHGVLLGEEWHRERHDLAAELSANAPFPGGINVGFARIVSAHNIHLEVFERGVGFTRACGTGAVAATGVATALHLIEADVPVRVDLPGGTLTVTVSGDLSNSFLEGPATVVFRGEIPG